MNHDDPNSYLGMTSGFAQLLVVLNGLVGGVLLSHILATLLRVSRKVTYVIFLWYFAVGVLSYCLLGPFSLSGDGAQYDAQAFAVAMDLGATSLQGVQAPLHDGKWGFPIILGMIYAIIGRMPLVAILLNCQVVAVTTVVIMATAKKLSGHVDYRWLLLFFVFCPSLITLGPAVMREALCWLGLSLVVYWLASLMSRGRPYNGLIAGLLGLSILAFVRTSLFSLTIAALFVAIIACVIYRWWGTKGLLLSCLIGIAVILLAGNPILQLAGFEPEYVLATRDYLADVATTGFNVTYGPLAQFGPAGMLLASLPRALVGPFPWEFSPQLVWLWVFISAGFWWLALALAFRRRKSFDSSVAYVGLIVFAGALTFGLAATLTNYGILARLRSLPLIILLVILSVGYERSNSRSEERTLCG